MRGEVSKGARSRDADASEFCKFHEQDRRRFRSSSDFSGGGGRFVTISAAHEIVGWAKARSAVPTLCICLLRFTAWASLRSAHPTKREKKEAERRKALFRNHRIVRCGAAPAGAARLPAFHHGSRLRDCSSRRLSVRPGFVGGGTSRAGHSAGRLMPELPGSEGDEPTARGHRTRPAEPASPASVLHGSEIRGGFVTVTVTKVNENATAARRSSTGVAGMPYSGNQR
jgi:hypothetical protein